MYCNIITTIPHYIKIDQWKKTSSIYNNFKINWFISTRNSCGVDGSRWSQYWIEWSAKNERIFQSNCLAFNKSWFFINNMCTHKKLWVVIVCFGFSLTFSYDALVRFMSFVYYERDKSQIHEELPIFKKKRIAARRIPLMIDT